MARCRALGSDTVSLLWVINATCLEGWPMIVGIPMATYQGTVQIHLYSQEWCKKPVSALWFIRFFSILGIWETCMNWSSSQCQGPEAGTF